MAGGRTGAIRASSTSGGGGPPIACGFYVLVEEARPWALGVRPLGGAEAGAPGFAARDLRLAHCRAVHVVVPGPRWAGVRRTLPR